MFSLTLWLNITIIYFLTINASVPDGIVTKLDSKFPGSRFNTVSMYDEDDTVYILGGDSIGLSTDRPTEIFKLSLSSEKLQIVAHFLVPEYGGRGYWDANGNIWYIGGHKRVWKFNPVNSNIINKNATGISIIGYNTPGFWNKRERTAYFFGGNTNPDSMKIYWELNNTAAELERFPSLDGFAAECVWDEPNNSAYVISSDFGAYLAKSRVSKYDPSTKTLVNQEISLPIWSQASTTVWDGTNVYVIGGFNSTTRNDVVKFNPVTKQVWALKIDGFPATLYDASAVYVKKLNRIYVFGGSQLSSPQYPYGRYSDEIFYISLNSGNENDVKGSHIDKENEETVMATNTIVQETDSDLKTKYKVNMNSGTASVFINFTLSLVIFVVSYICSCHT